MTTPGKNDDLRPKPGGVEKLVESEQEGGKISIVSRFAPVSDIGAKQEYHTEECRITKMGDFCDSYTFLPCP